MHVGMIDIADTLDMSIEFQFVSYFVNVQRS
jgi:hypothetical protein